MLELGAAVLSGLAIFVAILGGVPIWDVSIRKLYSKELGRMAELGFELGAFKWLMRLWGATILCLFIAGLVTSSVPLGTCLAFVTVFVPGWMMNYLIKTRTRVLRDQIVTACVGIGNAARANLNLVQAIQAASEEVPKPLKNELNLILRKVELYIPLGEALADVKKRIRIDGFTVFANAMSVVDDQGGDIADALQRIASSLQENQRIDRKIEADTQAGKMLVNISTVFPFIFLALFAFMEPEGTLALFQTSSGQVLLSVVIIATLAIRRWSRNIVDIDV